MKKEVKDFEELVTGKEFKKAGNMFFRLAYMYREDFDRILEKHNVTNSVYYFVFMNPAYGEHADQI